MSDAPPSEPATFTCANCGGTFTENWTDEEARAEFEKAFPDHDIAKASLICDDCHKEFVAWQRSMAGFAIGSDIWPGLSKLTEEMGETGQVIGKLMGTGGDIHHWDDDPDTLDVRLANELADLEAAIIYVRARNKLPDRTERVQRKVKTFNRWHDEKPQPPTPTGE